MGDKTKPVSAITADDIPAINTALAKGHRVELVPLKDGVKKIQIRRQEIRTKEKRSSQQL